MIYVLISTSLTIAERFVIVY